MAGVFIFSTCVIALRTGIFPRWIAFSGFACGLTLLLVIANSMWIAMLFPLWTILVSTYNSRSAEKVEKRQEKLTMEHSYEARPRKDKAASI
jgi:hypothetical protein